MGLVDGRGYSAKIPVVTASEIGPDRWCALAEENQLGSNLLHLTALTIFAPNTLIENTY